MESKLFKSKLLLSKLLFVSLVFLYSCGEDIDSGMDQETLQTDQATPLVSKASSGFGNQTITLTKGIVSANRAGFCYPTRIQPQVVMDDLNERSYKMKFQIKFDRYFDFDRGGKLGYGMFIGDGPGGCRSDDARANKGGSFRVMWRGTETEPNTGRCNVDTKKTTRAELFPYIYHKDMVDRCGEDFGKAYSIVRDKWYTIVMEFKSNTGSSRNGVAKLSIGPSGSSNFKTVLHNKNMVWSTDNSKNTVKVIKHNFFRGGANASWASHVDGKIYIKNVQLGI